MTRMHTRLLHLLLAFLLLSAQALVAMHAVEHAVQEGKGAPTHVCELCLATHDLGAALTGSAPALLLAMASFALFAASASGRLFLPALRARQQAPPLL